MFGLLVPEFWAVLIGGIYAVYLEVSPVAKHNSPGTRLQEIGIKPTIILHIKRDAANIGST